MKRIHRTRKTYNLPLKKGNKITHTYKLRLFKHKHMYILKYNIYYNKKVRVISKTKRYYMPNIYIIILLFLLLLLLAYIMFSSFNGFICYCNSDALNSNISSYDDSNTDIKPQLSTLNKSSCNIYKEKYDLNSMRIEHNDKNINNYNDSVILNKIKNLLLKESITEYKDYNNKVLHLETQINNNKVAYKSLIKDIDSIIKEFEPK